jgi:hypothetical protein
MGPPDALRQALERQLSRGLVELDSAGVVRAALADSFGCSRDSLTWTFHMRAGARFTDGTRVTSADIRNALVGGLAREDHATRAWLLAAVRGVSGVRAGRTLPALGIETAGEARLVLKLAVREPRLLEKLATPGTCTPWKRRRGGWRDAVGVGPYRVAGADGDRILTLVAASSPAGVRAAADTLRVRFLAGAMRVRNILRRSGTDVLWPLPPGFLDSGLPAGFELGGAPADPERRLLLVMRPDVPPLGRLEVREELARAIRPVELALVLGPLGEPLRRWPPGASESYAWPAPETGPSARRARRRNCPGRTRHDATWRNADRTGARPPPIVPSPITSCSRSMPTSPERASRRHSKVSGRRRETTQNYGPCTVMLRSRNRCAPPAHRPRSSSHKLRSGASSRSSRCWSSRSAGPSGAGSAPAGGRASSTAGCSRPVRRRYWTRTRFSIGSPSSGSCSRSPRCPGAWRFARGLASAHRPAVRTRLDGAGEGSGSARTR